MPLALRRLLRSPGFMLLAVGTLALGIGANTAIFSLVHELFLRGLPFREPERLARLYSEAKDRGHANLQFSVPRFWHFRDGQTVFEGLAADSDTGFSFAGLGEPVQIDGASVTANYFDVLGVRPRMGRLFTPDEERNPAVVLVSEAFWRNRLQSDPGVLGRSLALNGVARTIIGVMPDPPVAWWGPNREVWITRPFDVAGFTEERLMRGLSFLRVVGRLRAGVAPEQALAAQQALAASYRTKWPGNADNTWTPVQVPAAQDATGNLRPAFGTLLAAVGFVLLIACANVANLLLVRFTGRRREIAVRLALGSPRGTLVRLFLVESLTVAVLAGGLGVWLARLLLSAVGRQFSAAANPILALPLPAEPALHWPVLLGTLALSLVVGLVMGLYPAVQGARADVVDGLRDGGRGMSGSRGQQLFRRALVVAQVALSVVLLAGAGLLIASLAHLHQLDAGFRPERLWVGGVALPVSAYPDSGARARFAEQLAAELRAAPGVQAASVGDTVPLATIYSSSPYARADGDPPPVNQRPLGPTRSVVSGYLRTLGVPLLAGREFSEADGPDAPPVAVISRGAAQRLFPGEDPIGRRVLFGTDNYAGTAAEIVGVAGDVRSVQLSKSNEVEFYRPLAQRANTSLQILVRTVGAPEGALGLVRGVLARLDSTLPLVHPSAMNDVVAASLAPQRLTTFLLGCFAALALALAMVGIYGAVSYTVEQRAGELSVRMALGAQPRDVLRLVVSQGMVPVAVGLALGLVAALGLGRLISAQLYDISAHDPLLLVAVTAGLALTGLAACLVPAWRATRANPVDALRST